MRPYYSPFKLRIPNSPRTIRPIDKRILRPSFSWFWINDYAVYSAVCNGLFSLAKLRKHLTEFLVKFFCPIRHKFSYISKWLQRAGSCFFIYGLEV